jgi:NAD(P)-dependent dehydrogenase (short-subunit alcohol dehydrogenase family)
MPGQFEGQVAVVTSAGRGYGRAVARALAGRGAMVVAMDADATSLGGAAAEIEAAGGQVIPIKVDLSQAADAAAAFARVGDIYGRIHVLVAVAPLVSQAPFERLATREWDEVFSANLRAIVAATQQAVRLMRAGSVVYVTPPGEAVSPQLASARAALTGLAGALSPELAPRGIRVNCVVPAWPADIAGTTTADVVGAVHFFAGPDSVSVSGQAVTVTAPRAASPAETDDLGS